MTGWRTAARGAALMLAAAAPAAAQVAPFDLAGPRLSVGVRHGKASLPVAEVPNLSAGDVLTIDAELPADQSAHYLLVVAFLRGATNPPPKSWFHRAETWKPKGRTLTVTVPDGAQQAVAFLAPSTGGDFGTLVDAVRSRPGAFVRAGQDLNQAALDRARLDAFVAGINRRDAEGGSRLEAVSPPLARSLAIRLNADCLLRPPEAQARCLTGNSEALVLRDGHSASIADTLTGMPTSLAYQLSATREAGGGYYSPYIGVVRDVARILGAFRTADYQYIPALTTFDGQAEGGGMKLLLNAVPSFGKPKSVLVAALPPVGRTTPPPLRASKPDARHCLTRPGLVLPVEGAPLIHATRYARNLALRVTARDGREVDLPLLPDAERGGLAVVADALKPGDFDAELTGRIHGDWGFEPFEGPRMPLQIARADGWRAPDAAGELIVGRDAPLKLAGTGGSCIEAMTLHLPGGATRPVAWTQADGLVATLPLAGAVPGAMRLVLRLAGVADPVAIPLTAYAEAGRIDGLAIHAGDREGVLTGARLDMVKALTVDGTVFRAGTLSRAGGADRLTMIADTAPAIPAGDSRTGRLTLADGRAVSVRVAAAAPRPAATLIARTIVPAPAGPVPVTLPDGAVSQHDRLTFSLRAGDPTRFAPGDRVEVSAGSLTARAPLELQDDRVAVASVVPGTLLGDAAAGPLRFRLVQGDVAGDWQPLATLTRVPALSAASCTDAAGCTLAGRDLFLIAAAGPVTVPDGFTGSTLALPAEAVADGRLALRLRDQPDLIATARLR